MTTYYTYDPEAKRLNAAPEMLADAERTVINPPPEMYAAIGAYPRGEDTPPTPPEGKVAVPDGYELSPDGRAWLVHYRFEDAPPPPPRVFSKMKCVAALMEAGVWPQVKAYIEEAGLYDLYLAAQDFREDNAYFTQGRAALQTALGWTDEQVEAVLAASAKVEEE